MRRLLSWWRNRHLRALYAAHHPRIAAWQGLTKGSVVKPAKVIHIRECRTTRRKERVA